MWPMFRGRSVCVSDTFGETCKIGWANQVVWGKDSKEPCVRSGLGSLAQKKRHFGGRTYILGKRLGNQCVQHRDRQTHRPRNSCDTIRYDTIRYVTRCRFNVRSKADISQLNLPHGTNNLKVEREKNYEAKTDKRRSIGDNRPYSDTV